MVDKRAILIFLPAANGLPGVEERHFRRLQSEAPEMAWKIVSGRDAFLEYLPRADGAMVWGFRKEWLERAGRLRLVSTPAAGRDWMEIRSDAGREVWFGTFHGELMAETAIGLMLAFSRGIKATLDRQKSEPWQRSEIASLMRPLRGSRGLILGFGHIGKWVGRLLKPLGVRVTGVNRNDMARPGYFGPDDEVRPMEDLDRLLPDADHLLLCLPGGADSDGIIDAQRLGLLPRGAYVYNIGRGNALVAADLAAALRSGALGGAGLDVYESEPLPVDSPLRHCPNIILMPHVSAFAPNYLDLYFDEVVPRIQALFS